MTHFANSLPRQVELGAVRRLKYQTEIVTTDGGYEVRNARWATPLKTFEISYPPSRRDDPNYLAITSLYRQCLGSLHTFNFTDWTDETGGTVVTVRFDSDLTLTGIDPRYDHIDHINLIEVRE